jgi:hypothetical protein
MQRSCTEIGRVLWVDAIAISARTVHEGDEGLGVEGSGLCGPIDHGGVNNQPPSTVASVATLKGSGGSPGLNGDGPSVNPDRREDLRRGVVGYGAQGARRPRHRECCASRGAMRASPFHNRDRQASNRKNRDGQNNNDCSSAKHQPVRSFRQAAAEIDCFEVGRGPLVASNHGLSIHAPSDKRHGNPRTQAWFADPRMWRNRPCEVVPSRLVLVNDEVLGPETQRLWRLAD